MNTTKTPTKLKTTINKIKTPKTQFKKRSQTAKSKRLQPNLVSTLNNDHVYCMTHAESIKDRYRSINRRNIVFCDGAKRTFALSCCKCDKSCTCNTSQACFCEKKIKSHYEETIGQKITWDFDKIYTLLQ